MLNRRVITHLPHAPSQNSHDKTSHSHDTDTDKSTNIEQNDIPCKSTSSTDPRLTAEATPFIPQTQSPLTPSISSTDALERAVSALQLPHSEIERFNGDPLQYMLALHETVSSKGHDSSKNGL